jgi:hypothetical protein
MAFPLPFPKHKHYGEPIHLRSTRGAREVPGLGCEEDQRAKDAGETPERHALSISGTPSSQVTQNRKEVAERDQTKLELDPANEVRPTSTSVPVPPAGKVADALEPKEDPSSARALHKKVKKLLEHPTAISKEDREAYANDNVNGFKKHPLAWWVRSFENDVRVAEMAGEKAGADSGRRSVPECAAGLRRRSPLLSDGEDLAWKLNPGEAKGSAPTSRRQRHRRTRRGQR